MTFKISKEEKPYDYITYQPETLYIHENSELMWFICPCSLGCNRLVKLPTDGEWSVTDNDGLPTVRPSINNLGLPCKFHFYITNGEIMELPPARQDHVFQETIRRY